MKDTTTWVCLISDWREEDDFGKAGGGGGGGWMGGGRAKLNLKQRDD